MHWKEELFNFEPLQSLTPLRLTLCEKEAGKPRIIIISLQSNLAGQFRSFRKYHHNLEHDGNTSGAWLSVLGLKG